MQGSVDCVQLLLAHGANANKADAVSAARCCAHDASVLNRAGKVLRRAALVHVRATCVLCVL
jgi:hypothetical protein